MAKVKGRKIFGKKLAEARYSADFSQEEFAAKAGISRGTIARYEGAEVVRVSRGAMRKMAIAFGIPLEALERKIGAPADAIAEEFTTVRLPLDLNDAIRGAAKDKQTPVHLFLWDLLNQKSEKAGGGRTMRKAAKREE